MMYADSRIEGVAFSLKTDADTLKEGAVLIKSNAQMKGQQPVDGGIFDKRMGVAVHGVGMICRICMNDKRLCTGHPGTYKLPIPVFNTAANSRILHWLNVVCHECGNYPVKFEAPMTLERLHSKLNKSSATKSGKAVEPVICIHCKTIMPNVINHSESQYKKVLFTKRTRTDSGLVPENINAEYAEKVFSRMRPDQHLALGELDHPLAFIINYLQIPSVVCRPPIMSSAKKSSNDLTSFISNLITHGMAVSSEVKKEKRLELERKFAMFVLDYTYKSGEADSSTSLFAALKSKKGIFRGLIMSKTTEAACRAVIVCDDMVPPNVVVIPRRFAQANTVPVRVRSFNIERLAKLVLNGSEYPGVSSVVRDGVEQRITEGFQLQLGDIVKRHVIAGDCGIIGRNPTLSDKCKGNVYVLIDYDLKSSTLRINVSAVGMFGGDFDGDQMSIKFLESPAARIECNMVMGIGRDLQYIKSGAPILGQVQDAILGVALLTYSNVRMTRRMAMHLMRNCQQPRELKLTNPWDGGEWKMVSGRDLISLFLPPINYKRKSKFVEATKYLAFKDLTEADGNIEIKAGRLISGVLDGSAIKESSDSIFAQIMRDYGPEAMLNCTHDIQQVAIAFLRMWGATVGLMDFVVPDKAQHALNEEEDKVIAKYLHHVELLRTGGLDPPVGMGVQRFYELCQMSNLMRGDQYDAIIFRSTEYFNMLQMVLHGSKGNMDHMRNFVAPMGIVPVAGDLLPMRLSHWRSNAYWQRCSMDPCSRGYVRNSLNTGLSPAEMMTFLAGSRFDASCRALATADTGSLNRIGNKSTESFVVDYCYSLKNGYTGKVIQLLYGDDGFHPNSLESCKIDMVFLPDADFNLKYREGQAALFELCVRTRDAVRRSLKRIHWSRPMSLINNYFRLPFNLGRIVAAETLSAGTKKRGGSAANGATLLEYVERFGEHYFGGRTPALYHKASTLMKASVLSELVPLVGRMSPETLTRILTAVSDKVRRGLVCAGLMAGVLAAQSLSEPLSQYMLDATHGSIGGGTKKDSIKTYENLGNAKPDSMFSNATMSIYPLAAQDEVAVRKLASRLEETRVVQFTTVVKTMVSGVDVLTLPEVAAYLKANPSMRPRRKASHLYFYLEFSPLIMFDKSVSMSTVCEALQNHFGDLVLLVPSAQTATTPALRVVPLFAEYNKQDLSDSYDVLRDDIMGLTAKGVAGLTHVRVKKLVRNEFTSEGLKPLQGWFIETSGVNVEGVVVYPEIDHSLTLCNIPDTNYRTHGLAACRASNITEIKQILALRQGDVHWHHFSIYADALTCTGYQTGITPKGTKAREPGNILLHAAFKSPATSFVAAANNHVFNQIRGLSAAMAAGTIPRIGTEVCDVVVNIPFVKSKGPKRVEDLFD